jgi:diguanylate cyclase (GGDEF)-like protein
VVERDDLMRRAYVLASIALIGAYPLLSDSGRVAVFLVMSIGVLVPLTVGLRQVDAGRRLPWQILVCAVVTINVGYLLRLGFDASGDASGRLLDAAGNLFVLVAALSLVMRRGRNDLGGIIDATIAAVATGGVLWEAVIRANVVDAYQGGAAQVDTFVAVFALCGVVGALVRLAQSSPESASAVRLLIAALALAIGANLLYVTQSDSWLHTLSSMMFLGTYTFLGLFGLNPTAPLLAEPAAASPRDAISVRRLVLLGLAVCVIPVTVGVRALQGATIDGLILIAGCGSIAALVMARIGLLAAERERAEEALAHRATHDPLTDLPNRRRFVTNLDDRISRHKQSVILFCDLDGFKAVNDRLGHAAGDQLLVEIAQRLRTCVRDTDMVSRFGGDEFLILVDNAVPSDAEAICRRIASALSRPFRVLGEPITVGASIGTAIAAPGADAETSIRHADQAMYAAKRTGTTRDGIRMTSPLSLDVRD